MLSFKQYLTEDLEENEIQLFWTFRFNVGHLRHYATTNITKKLSFENRIADIKLDNNNVSIFIKNIKPSEYQYYDNVKKIFIEPLTKRLISFLKTKNLGKDVDFENITYDFGSTYSFNDLPIGPIEVQDINITLQKETSLKNINKIITKADYVLIYKTEFITNGVLELLKINSTHVIPVGSIPWKDIFIKYWNTSKNILKCQKELINAGLKDYC